MAHDRKKVGLGLFAFQRLVTRFDQFGFCGDFLAYVAQETDEQIFTVLFHHFQG